MTSIIYGNQKLRLLSLPIALMATLLFQRPSHAAIVDISFMTGTKVKLNGALIKANNYISLLGILAENIRLKISNSLLGDLDSKTPFYVGSVRRGKVYLMGGDMGIEGKLISREDDVITFYDAICLIVHG